MPTGYPSSPQEVLDDRMRFKAEALAAVNEFKATNPWSGSLDERFLKFKHLNFMLSQAYGIREPTLEMEDMTGGNSYHSQYQGDRHAIVMRGKLSVLTYLHEFAHARGRNEWQASKWSINLFKRVFPEKYARLGNVGHTLVVRQEKGKDVVHFKSQEINKPVKVSRGKDGRRAHRRRKPRRRRA